MKKFIAILALCGLSQFPLAAQSTPFGIELESIKINNLGGLQAYAFGQHNGKWLVVGGRLDGLHRRQPWAAFDAAGHNNQLIVIDPELKKQWSTSLSSLPTSIHEQLSSTNMEFIQSGDYLYCIGGYGYSATISDHTTYPNLTAIKIPEVMNGIINGTPIEPFFRQITDTMFQVTGGKLKKIDETYYLLGGQKFLGKYNPMGPNHGPGFIQEYTNAIRKFKITDNDTTLVISHLPSYYDVTNLHRRDYNAEAQIMPDGKEGITMFSGVFQPNINLPFLTSVNIDNTGYRVNNSFKQYYNHYHCAVIPLYSTTNNEMHNIFFGGIAQYFDSAGVLVQDNDVPFVNTIARVTRDANGKMVEYKMPTEMPNLLGAGSEFIVNKRLALFDNEVIKLDEIAEQKTLLGYIYGGISSNAANIFFTNNGTQSKASSEILAVYMVNNPDAIDQPNNQSSGTLNLSVFPNPAKKQINIQFDMLTNEPIRISIYDASGQLLEQEIIAHPKLGKNKTSHRIKAFDNSGIYLITVESDKEKAVQKIIVH